MQGILVGTVLLARASLSPIVGIWALQQFCGPRLVDEQGANVLVLSLPGFKKFQKPFLILGSSEA